MRWSVIRTIWFREVRDQLRDRRTLFMLVVLPMLLYPLLGIVMLQMTSLFASQSLVIGVAGHDFLVEDGFFPPLVAGGEDRFLVSLFPEPGDRGLLRVVQDSPERLKEMLKRDEIQALITFDDDLLERIRRGQQVQLNVQLRDGQLVEPSQLRGGARASGPLLTSDDDRSRLAFERLRGVLREWEREIVKRRLTELGKPADYARPLVLATLNSKSDKVWTNVFPFLIVMMSLTGALYPAIDVCAGEKERGTMETLLISPASRAEIVLGKFLTVWLFSTAMALLNLASMGLTALVFSSMFNQSAGLAVVGGLPAPGVAAILWCIVLLVPLAAFFSAVCLSLAVYARSSKEGQYYLMPLMVATMLLTFLSLAPGIRLSPPLSLLPVTGAALLLQTLMAAGSAEQVPWLYLAPVLVPLAAYCYLALYWAIAQFNREEVLFREAERLDLALWLKRLLRQKEPLPSATMAMICFLVVLFLTWMVSIRAGQASLLTRTAVLQLACIAAPTVLMATLLTSSPRLTLRLRWPRVESDAATPSILASVSSSRALSLLAWVLAAGLLALALHGPLMALVWVVLEQFPGLKEQLQEQERLAFAIFAPDTPLVAQLVVLAGLPAICEELAFRGFILSGLVRRLGVRRAIVTSSILFAFAHMGAFQFLPTFVLGLILATLATRAGSLFPGMVFHFVHNGMLMLAGYSEVHKLAGWSTVFSGAGFYSVPAIIAGLLVAGPLLVLLARLPPRPVLDVPENPP